MSRTTSWRMDAAGSSRCFGSGASAAYCAPATECRATSAAVEQLTDRLRDIEASAAGAGRCSPCELQPPVDVSSSGDGSVVKVVTKFGVGDETPAPGDRVCLHGVGRAPDGEVFLDTRREGPVTFKLGKNSKILPRAVHLAVATMKRGEACRVTAAVVPDPIGQTDAETPPSGNDASRLEYYDLELLCWTGRDLTAEKDGGILKSTLQRGTGKFKPTVGSQVKVELIGKCNDQTFEHRIVAFTCGNGCAMGVVDGVDVAMTEVVVGEKVRLQLKPDYAFGAGGKPELGVPPNSEVVYEVTLKQAEQVKEPWELTVLERLNESKASKETGNRFYSEGKLQHALRWYERAVRHADPDLAKRGHLTCRTRLACTSSDQHDVVAAPMLEGCGQEEQRSLLTAALLNSAQCRLKLGHYIAARHCCESVLAFDTTNKKALYRHVQASMELGDWEAAKCQCSRLLAIDPESSCAKVQLAVIKDKLRACGDREKALYAQMFAKLAVRPMQETKRPGEKTIFDEPIGDWSNDMADGIMTIQQELQAFGECMPEHGDALSGCDDNPNEPQG